MNNNAVLIDAVPGIAVRQSLRQCRTCPKLREEKAARCQRAEEEGHDVLEPGAVRDGVAF